jgi:hypothetical protein
MCLTAAFARGADFGFLSYQNLDPFSKAISDGGESTNKDRKQLSSLAIPSPKSPKVNPFSKPSPVHNPFMSIVESKDDLWNTVSRAHEDKLTDKALADSSNSIDEPNRSGDVASAKASAPESSISEKSLAEACAREENRVYGKVYSMSAGPVSNGEEGEECIYQVRAKLFKLRTKKSKVDDDAAGGGSNEKKGAGSSSQEEPMTADWLEVGVGPVKLLKSSSDACRLVMRRESKIGGVGER